MNYDKALEKFKEYVGLYDLNDGKIKHKFNHTLNVVMWSEKISKALELSNEDKELAKLIALLHDIGRFEQAKKFGNFRDYQTTDHADVGIEILFDNNLIREFIEISDFDEIIKKAIVNHNKFGIEDGLDERTLLHARLIKDADKMDNFRAKVEEDIYVMSNITQDELENSLITDKIFEDFMSCTTIVSKERVTGIDVWISYIAFVFGINFTCTLKFVKEEDFVNKLVTKYDYKLEETKKKMNIIRNHVNNYINSRLI